MVKLLTFCRTAIAKVDTLKTLKGFSYPFPFRRAVVSYLKASISSANLDLRYTYILFVWENNMEFEEVEVNSERWLDLKDFLNEEWRDIKRV